MSIDGKIDIDIDNPSNGNHNNDDIVLNIYIESMTPKQELICPITQELFNDPVVAEDGYTYERLALQRWFHDSKNKVIRSPVTNSYLTGQSMFPNIAIKGMVHSHRNYLGNELLNRCFEIYQSNEKLNDHNDNARIIKALLDAGADTTLRINAPSTCPYDGNTCLLFLMQCQNIELSKIIMSYEYQRLQQQLQCHVNKYKHKVSLLPNIDDNDMDGNNIDSNIVSEINDDGNSKVGDNNDNISNKASKTSTLNYITTMNNGLVTMSNAKGISCINAISSILENEESNTSKLKCESHRKEWEELLIQMKQCEITEKVIAFDKKIQHQKDSNRYKELQLALQQEQERQQRTREIVALTRAYNHTNYTSTEWRYYPTITTTNNGSVAINVNDNTNSSNNENTTDTTATNNKILSNLKLLWEKVKCFFIAVLTVTLFFAVVYLLTCFFFGRRFTSF